MYEESGMIKRGMSMNEDSGIVKRGMSMNEERGKSTNEERKESGMSTWSIWGMYRPSMLLSFVSELSVKSAPSLVG